MQNDLILDKYNAASVSDINLESPNCAGDMAIRGFGVQKLYDDFVFADYIDVDNGYIKHDSGLVTVDTSSSKTWRKAKVLMVGPSCRETSVGDIILFPNDKGLPCGEVEYVTNGGLAKALNGIFLSEHRIFAALKHVSESVNS
jgi:hypothetical protein